MTWKGAALRPVMSEVQESMAVPSDHCEKMLMTSPEATVGGVSTLLILNEKVDEIL